MGDIEWWGEIWKNENGKGGILNMEGWVKLLVLVAWKLQLFVHRRYAHLVWASLRNRREWIIIIEQNRYWGSILESAPHWLHYESWREQFKKPKLPPESPVYFGGLKDYKGILTPWCYSFSSLLFLFFCPSSELLSFVVVVVFVLEPYNISVTCSMFSYISGLCWQVRVVELQVCCAPALGLLIWICSLFSYSLLRTHTLYFLKSLLEKRNFGCRICMGLLFWDARN